MLSSTESLRMIAHLYGDDLVTRATRARSESLPQVVGSALILPRSQLPWTTEEDHEV